MQDMHLFYFVSIAFYRCNAPFQTRGMKNFLPLCFFENASAFRTQRESPWTWNGVILLKLKWIVTLQNFRSPAKKWNVDHKNVIHIKLKQLYFNVAWNQCYLILVWSQMKVISTQCRLVWNEYGLKCCLKSAARYRPWKSHPLQLLKFVCKNTKWKKNMFSVH